MYCSRGYFPKSYIVIPNTEDYILLYKYIGPFVFA